MSTYLQAIRINGNTIVIKKDIIKFCEEQPDGNWRIIFDDDVEILVDRMSGLSIRSSLIN
jgi:hypothetical protein